MTGPGTLILSGPNTYSGGTTLSQGILSISSAGNLGTGNITGNGGTLQTTATINPLALGISLNPSTTTSIAPNGATSLTLSGVISNSGSLAMTGPGTLILSGPNTYSGGTIRECEGF